MIYFWILQFQISDSVAALLIRLDVGRLSLESLMEFQLLMLAKAFWCSQLIAVQDSTGYQITLIPEIEARLKSKCDRLVAAFEADETGEVFETCGSARTGLIL